MTNGRFVFRTPAPALISPQVREGRPPPGLPYPDGAFPQAASALSRDAAASGIGEAGGGRFG